MGRRNMCAEIKKWDFQEWKDLERIRRDDVGLFCLFSSLENKVDPNTIDGIRG